ncbi:MAG: sensor histidine kinase [Pseudomonadota bacterium]|jgi:two-component system sensor histidine kinase HupT/HoxJ
MDSGRKRPPGSEGHKAPVEGVGEETWLEVIRKMDEVYSQLVADEVALEEKNAQLEQSQRFIVSLLSSMSDVLLATDAEGRIEDVNASLCALVGQNERQLRGTPAADLLAGGDNHARLRGATEAAQLQRDAVMVELELMDGHGQRVPVEFNCTARVDTAGRRMGHVLVGRPTGEIKRAYLELQASHEALKRAQQQLLHAEKLASLGRLVAGVAHELNNPISFVLGNVHALARYAERLQRYLDALHGGATAGDLATLRQELRIDQLRGDLPSLIEGTLEGASRTAEIVQGLRRFSAIDREHRVRVDVNEVVEQAIRWVTKGTAPSFIVHWQPCPGAAVTGSASQLQQVLMNLIQNAYDAAADQAQPQLWIAVRIEGPSLILTLRDNGPGIPAPDMARIFDPFFTTKPVGKGTGLGLSISYGIVEQHGGRLEARNAAQGGAEFTIRLPLAA